MFWFSHHERGVIISSFVLMMRIITNSFRIFIITPRRLDKETFKPEGDENLIVWNFMSNFKLIYIFTAIIAFCNYEINFRLRNKQQLNDLSLTNSYKWTLLCVEVNTTTTTRAKNHNLLRVGVAVVSRNEFMTILIKLKSHSTIREWGYFSWHKRALNNLYFVIKCCINHKVMDDKSFHLNREHAKNIFINSTSWTLSEDENKRSKTADI